MGRMTPAPSDVVSANGGAVRAQWQGRCPHCGSKRRPGSDARPAPVVYPVSPDRVGMLRATAVRFTKDVARRVPESTFDIWLGPLQLLDASRDELVIGGPSEITTWVRDRFGEVLRVSASELAGREMRIVVVDQESDVATSFDQLREMA